MAGISPLINLIENPTEYVKATGRVRILSIPSDDVETVDNIGTGVELVDNTDVHNPKIRTLTNGSDITITQVGDDVEINYSGVPPNSDMVNAGAGEGLLEPGSVGILPVNTVRNFKSLTAGTNITLTPTADEIEISASGGVSSVTLSNLVPAPPFGGANILDNPGTGAGPFNFKEIVESAGINITSGPTDITVSVSPMEPSQLGGIYGNQTNEDNIIGNLNNVQAGSNNFSNVIGCDLPATLVPQVSNIMVSYQNMSTANAVYSNSNIILSGAGSEIGSTSNSSIYGSSIIAPSTSLNNCIYIGDMNATTVADNSICINSNLHNNAIQMDKESVYMGTGQNIMTLSSGECHFDFKCPAWYYHDLAGAASGTGHLLHYDNITQQITYDVPPSINSTFSNVGAGQSLLEAGSIGTFPVTTTRNFKTLVAGSNITLTPGLNDITIASSAASNIYNTDGSLISARTLTLGGFNLTVTGTGNYNITNTGQLNLGTANSTVVNIGRNGIQTQFASASIAFTNLPLAVTTPTSIVVFDTASKVIRYTGAIVYRQIVSVGLQSFTVAGGATYNVPSTFAISYSTAQPTNRPGYNLSSELNLSSGTFTPTLSTTQYNVFMRVTVKNDTEVCNFVIELRDVINAVAVTSVTCNGGVINQFNTFILNDNINLINGRPYIFRIISSNGGGSTYTFSEVAMSINYL